MESYQTCQQLDKQDSRKRALLVFFVLSALVAFLVGGLDAERGPKSDPGFLVYVEVKSIMCAIALVCVSLPCVYWLYQLVTASLLAWCFVSTAVAVLSLFGTITVHAGARSVIGGTLSVHFRGKQDFIALQLLLLLSLWVYLKSGRASSRATFWVPVFLFGATVCLLLAEGVALASRFGDGLAPPGPPPSFGDILSPFECDNRTLEEELAGLKMQQEESRKTRTPHWKIKEGASGAMLAAVETLANAEQTRNAFEIAAAISYACIARATNLTAPRGKLDVEHWLGRASGGLTDADRIVMARYYRNADSVFEFGVGESTFLAAEVGVPRYAGIDSDAAFVTMVRDRTPGRFRLYLADIGHTLSWGEPAKPTLAKNGFDYQAAALSAEPAAFDVYMVDGRFRVACALLALLHASARGGDAGRVRVLIHDYPIREHYFGVEQVAEKVDSSSSLPDPQQPDELLPGSLVVLRRRPGVSDEEILRLWNQYKFNKS